MAWEGWFGDGDVVLEEAAKCVIRVVSGGMDVCLREFGRSTTAYGRANYELYLCHL
jgi:hypothetical protein